jgi:hypothetical protein
MESDGSFTTACRKFNLHQMNSLQYTRTIFKAHINIILPFTPRPSTLSLPFRFTNYIFYALLICPIRATCSAHLIALDLITVIIFSEQYIRVLYSFSLCNCLHLPLTRHCWVQIHTPSPHQTPSSYVEKLAHSLQTAIRYVHTGWRL